MKLLWILVVINLFSCKDNQITVSPDKAKFNFLITDAKCYGENDCLFFLKDKRSYEVKCIWIYGDEVISSDLDFSFGYNYDVANESLRFIRYNSGPSTYDFLVFNVNPIPHIEFYSFVYAYDLEHSFISYIDSSKFRIRNLVSGSEESITLLAENCPTNYIESCINRVMVYPDSIVLDLYSDAKRTFVKRQIHLEGEGKSTFKIEYSD